MFIFRHCDGTADCNGKILILFFIYLFFEFKYSFFFDSKDASDEIGCSPPMIVQSPDRQIIVAEGENVTLNCKAIGTPTPIISWKHNWDSIKSTDSRSIASSNNGFGILTIKNVRQSDTGKF